MFLTQLGGLRAIEGASYPAIIQKRIFDRAGMTASIAVIDGEARTKPPTSYSQWPYNNEYLEEPWFEYRAADGSIASNGGDMLAYTRLILNHGVGPKGRVLSEQAFTMLTTPPSGMYAYGLVVRNQDGNTVIGHGGGIAGFNTQMDAFMNDGFGVVVLGNASLNQGLNLWIANTVKAAFRGEALPALPARLSAEQMIAAMSDFAGVYAAPAGNSVEFVATGTGLAIKQGTRTFTLTRIARDSFRSTEKPFIAFPFTFERDGTKSVAVSHGPDWYAGAAYTGAKEFKNRPELEQFVGRYENHNPEGAPVRVFVRKGQLFFANGISEASALIEVGPNLFRPAQPEFNPERYRFDSIVEGQALRLLISGMPLYRGDDR